MAPFVPFRAVVRDQDPAHREAEVNDLLDYRPHREKRGRRVPATNHGARGQAEHPAPDGSWPIDPPWYRRLAAFTPSDRAQNIAVHVALAVIFLAICWTFVGCGR